MSQQVTTLDYHWAKTLYERHPVLAAFRKRVDGCSTMVSCLHEAFEQRRQSRYLEPDQINRITDFLVATDQLDPSARLSRDYLDKWTKDGMLRRFYDDLLHDEPFYELTPDAVLLLRWLQELDQHEFVRYNISWDGAPRTFRLVVIDEAFGRGSKESTRYGLELFGRMNLQLLIVTPGEKVNVIQRYVQHVHYIAKGTDEMSKVRKEARELHKTALSDD